MLGAAMLLVATGASGCATAAQARLVGAEASSPAPAAPAIGHVGTIVSPTSLTRPQFIEQANEVCARLNTQFRALPAVTTAADSATLAAAVNSRISTFHSYLTQVAALAELSPDHVVLMKRWIGVELADSQQVTTLLRNLVAARRSGDAVAVRSAGAQLQRAPDHAASLGALLTSYQLPRCASLQQSTRLGDTS